MSRASMSSATSRADAIEHYRGTYNVDHDSACLIVRAERLQEKGQIDQALIYFEQALQNYPNVNEARVNVDMIRRMKAAPLPVVQESERVLPNSAEISFYYEHPNGITTLCERFACLKRLPNRWSEHQAACCIQGWSGPSPKIRFPPDQSDSLWSQLLEAIEDGSGLSASEPTPRDWRYDISLGYGIDQFWVAAMAKRAAYKRGVGEQVTLCIEGQEDRVFFANNSPVQRIFEEFVRKRKLELGM